MLECADSNAMHNVSTVLARVPRQCNADEFFNFIQMCRIRVGALERRLSIGGAVDVRNDGLAFAALRCLRDCKRCGAHRVWRSVGGPRFSHRRRPVHGDASTW